MDEYTTTAASLLIVTTNGATSGGFGSNVLFVTRKYSGFDECAVHVCCCAVVRLVVNISTAFDRLMRDSLLLLASTFMTSIK